MIRSSLSGFVKSAKLERDRKFSETGWDAHVFISAIGAHLVTGTHIRRASLRKFTDAFLVCNVDIGLPSVITMTTDWASARPRLSSLLAALSAFAV